MMSKISPLSAKKFKVQTSFLKVFITFAADNTKNFIFLDL